MTSIHSKIRLLPAAFCAGAMLLGAASCSSDKYKIEGKVANAKPDSHIVLERADPAGGWLTLDSVELSKGEFKFSGERMPAPEIFRLRLDGEYIYLPVDSTETVSVSTDAAHFASAFTLDGSDDARQMERFEKELLSFSGFDSPQATEDFRRKIFTEYLRESRGSIVSYYILTKTVDGKPLFDPAEDFKYMAAVATSFKQFAPDDPRTPLLERISTEALRRHNKEKGARQVLHATEISLLEISLPDETGAAKSLSQTVGKGRPAVLVFANLTGEGDPARNMQLRKIAERADIYQVSFDDRYQWRAGAANLPWATVWGGDSQAGAKALQDYNVQELPTFFIFDATGQLTGRAGSIDELARKL